MRPPEPGRNALLDAGQRLLGSADLARISVNAIVAEAGMAKGSFYQHWPSRSEYLRALHARFHDDLQESITAAMGDLPPGRDRLEAGMNAYLDGCLADPATKALLVQSRTEAGLSDLVAARNQSSATLILPDLAALGWAPPEPVAVLLVAAVAEIALIELAGGKRDKQLRRGLLRLATRTG
ncbi:TetR/AcrR family transcriptional regulator [Mycobacterium terramassiliense]|uniref:TetR/AcrR family transcriptional regulator n=1 Tax=Mycobacterium terramassiliense TaxID=1841859 RepID=UPI00097D115D|nr:TetR/AcrR family transcriptional regulator [Mycobacterium terramassiliense]